MLFNQLNTFFYYLPGVAFASTVGASTVAPLDGGGVVVAVDDGGGGGVAVGVAAGASSNVQPGFKAIIGFFLRTIPAATALVMLLNLPLY